MLVVGAALIFTAAGAQATLAQVGHRPESSPYRDLRIKQTLTFMGGLLTGGGGKAGVGPSSGPLGGVRWDFHVGSSIALFLGGHASDLERRLINPIEPPGGGRELGTAQQNVWMAEGGINLLLTGRKTWHGFAPYAGAAFGMVFGTEVPEDSVFTFGRKFHIGPAAGIRFFLNRRFHIRLEARDIIWRMTYPQVFLTIPEGEPQIPVIDGDVSTLAEWVHHPTFFIGLGWTLRF
jgi:hypothetical protein